MPLQRAQCGTRVPQEHPAQQHQGYRDHNHRHRQARLVLIKIRPVIGRQRGRRHLHATMRPQVSRELRVLNRLRNSRF